MTLCRLMCLDFMESVGRYEDNGEQRYSDSDLDEGAAYASWLMEEGYVAEPFYGFSLKDFRDWCLRKLCHTGQPMSQRG